MSRMTRSEQAKRQRRNQRGEFEDENRRRVPDAGDLDRYRPPVWQPDDGTSSYADGHGGLYDVRHMGDGNGHVVTVRQSRAPSNDPDAWRGRRTTMTTRRVSLDIASEDGQRVHADRMARVNDRLEQRIALHNRELDPVTEAPIVGVKAVRNPDGTLTVRPSYGKPPRRPLLPWRRREWDRMRQQEEHNHTHGYPLHMPAEDPLIHPGERVGRSRSEHPPVPMPPARRPVPTPPPHAPVPTPLGANDKPTERMLGEFSRIPGVHSAEAVDGRSKGDVVSIRYATGRRAYGTWVRPGVFSLAVGNPGRNATGTRTVLETDLTGMDEHARQRELNRIIRRGLTA